MRQAWPNDTDQTDQQLMERVARGDVRAFEAIYDRYQHRAFSLARRITGSADAAEEATQDAFLSLWRKAARFDAERASLGAWLLTLVRNRSIDLMRREGPRAARQTATESAAELLEAPERVETQVEADQEGDRARHLLGGLPAEQREVIELAYFSGWTQLEIAARLGVPLGTVKGRTRLGLRKLRDATASDPVLSPRSLAA